ncbi:MAG TPA: carboxypeptidase-like regulatory domain-containing protein, partial [Puia sp.]|nr:carboxypeptidase-like regulatory domain-containing protein [Puia sp.]
MGHTPVRYRFARAWLILLAIGLHVAAKAVSQTVSLSGKDLSVLQIFDAVKKQTHYSIFYDKDLLAGAKPVSIKATNMPVNEFLSAALKDQSFEFYIENQTIFLRKKLVQEAAVISNAERKAAPPPPITGIVIGPDGKPLVGANIMLKGTKKGTTTDNEGKFSIDASAGQTLVISSVGYASQEIAVGARSAFEIRLVYEDKSLNTVMITAL